MTPPQMQSFYRIATVGEQPICLSLSADVYPDSLVRQCAANYAPDIVVESDGRITIAPKGILSRHRLREFMRDLHAMLRERE